METDPRRLLSEICVRCGTPITAFFEASYCQRCSCPVHNRCAAPNSADPESCAECGANATAQASSRLRLRPKLANAGNEDPPSPRPAESHQRNRIFYLLGAIAIVLALAELGWFMFRSSNARLTATRTEKGMPPESVVFLHDGGVAYVRVHTFLAKADADAAPKGSEASFAFGESVNLVQQRQAKVPFWLVSKSDGSVTAWIPEYMLTADSTVISLLKSKGRIPDSMTYVFKDRNSGVASTFGRTRVFAGGLVMEVDSEGLALSAEGGTKQLAFKGNAVVFDPAVASLSYGGFTFVRGDKSDKGEDLSSTIIYYCTDVDVDGKGSFDEIELANSDRTLLLDPTINGAVDAAAHRNVEIHAKITSAQWRKDGSLSIRFEGVDNNHFCVSVSPRVKQALNDKFQGNAATGLSGAAVRISGKLEDLLVVDDKGFYHCAEINIDSPDQIDTDSAGSGQQVATHASNTISVSVVSVLAPDKVTAKHRCEITAMIKNTGLADRMVRVNLAEVGDDGKPIEPSSGAVTAGGIPLRPEGKPGDIEQVAGDMVSLPYPEPGAAHESTGMNLVLQSNAGGQKIVLTYTPQTAGLRKLAVWIDPIPGEKDVTRHRKDFQILVAAPPIKVLYIEGRIRPEWSRLRRMFKLDADVEFSELTHLIDTWEADGTVDGKPVSGMPSTQEEWNMFNVILIGDLDSSLLTPTQQAMIQRRVKDGGGLMMIGGFASGGWDKTTLSNLLPVSLAYVEPAQINTKFVPQLTAAGTMHPIFHNIAGYFLSPDGKAPAEQMPDLSGCVALSGAKPGAEVLAVHPTEKVGARPAIVLAVQQYGRGRVAAFAADSTWRWEPFLRQLGKKSPYDQFWDRLVGWLAGEDDPNNMGHIEWKLDSRSKTSASQPATAPPSSAGYRRYP